MRITYNMLANNLLHNLEAAQGRMDKLQDQMSTGYRITKPSDDPVGIQNALRVKSSIAAVEQWKNNASEALSYMNTTDSVLGDITSMLQRVRELTVQAANDTEKGTDRQAILMEVDQIADQIRMVANTQVGNKYIFSGTKTTTEPFSSDGTWQGNEDSIKFVIGNGETIDISVDGKQMFEGIFNVLKNLSTALANDNGTEIGNLIQDLDKNIDSVLTVRADVGARTNRLTSLQDQLETTSTNLTKNLSDIQDADLAATIIEFKNQENVYRAALAVGAQIIQPSLVDFMK